MTYSKVQNRRRAEYKNKFFENYFIEKKKSNLKISIAYGKNYKSKAKRRLYTKLALDFLSDICHLTSCSLAAVKEKLVDIFIKGSALKNLSPSIKDFYRLLKEGST